MFLFQAISRIHGAPYKNILSNAYWIVNSTTQNVEADIYTKLMIDDIFPKDVLKRKPYCQVEKVETEENNRIPRAITHVKLKKQKDSSHCRPVVQKITYLEEEPEFNKVFQQKLYRIKQREFIVAFEAFPA